MATDIYPAIRREVEALADATVQLHLATVWRPEKQEEAQERYNAARAALNRRVEEVVAAGIQLGVGARDKLSIIGKKLTYPEKLARRLLNEEPAE